MVGSFSPAHEMAAYWPSFFFASKMTGDAGFRIASPYSLLPPAAHLPARPQT